MKYEVNEMKELYIAPEAELIRFAPFEKLAYDESWRSFSNDGSEIEIPETGNPGMDGDIN